MAPTISTSSSLSSIHEAVMETPTAKEERPVVMRSPKEAAMQLIKEVESDDLRRSLRSEIKRLISDHDRLVSILQQRSEILEHENFELKEIASEHQRRYEKAVREMQFFRKKYERAAELNKQYINQQPRSLSIESSSSTEAEPSRKRQPSVSIAAQQPYPLTPTSPQPGALDPPHPTASAGGYEQDFQRHKPSMPSRSSSTSTNSSAASARYWPGSPVSSGGPSAGPVDAGAPPVPRLRQNSVTTSVHSTSTDGQSSQSKEKTPRRKRSWQSNQPPPHLQQQQQHQPTTSVSTAPTTTSASSASSAPSSTSANSVQSVPMTPVRSSTATNGYTGASLIQQRRVDPLIFGGSDGLWETIAKSKGSDVTVEKIISNFLRRGGSPNTAKQSPSANAVKYGYGMIHALIVTKAPGSLDLLLQQGANPNVMTLSQTEEDKVTPCYLAAGVGWLTGLQKLVQAGGDLMSARGAGVRNKTALHVAAEHCHAAVVEYIVEVTQGALNLEEDSNGATVLHYACASGHTDLVSFLARSCQIPVNQADHRGEMPLHWAARHGRLEVVTLLVERCGCDFNAYVPRKVGTPLDLAKAGGHRRLVDYLKGLGALTARKVDKRREEELAREVPGHLESTLARAGFFGDGVPSGGGGGLF
ncbi:ankyrin repeat-containing domain protein [Syncephalastrum racemosum]|uniref:Ankyrin repeat-containing domain protein n=1 Tax=Syncephalastrum racemosum TaxID=13706 RepID=A0A1X2H450_SYNRA|nr:ankyrin repeat-containing domain protein [Syncephalastrum racemosum]